MKIDGQVMLQVYAYINNHSINTIADYVLHPNSYSFGRESMSPNSASPRCDDSILHSISIAPEYDASGIPRLFSIISPSVFESCWRISCLFPLTSRITVLFNTPDTSPTADVAASFIMCPAMVTMPRNNN